MVIKILIRPLVLGHYMKKTNNPEYYLELEETTCLDEVINHDFSDAPEWACPREWFIKSKYELEWNDPETGCFMEKPDY